jgi:hypothetical protein
MKGNTQSFHVTRHHADNRQVGVQSDDIIENVKLSLTLREEHRLRVFENRVLRRTFGLKKDEVTENCRKLHNEELRDL